MAVTNYYTVNGEIIGEKTAGSPRVDYLTDALGSVTATVNQSAQIVNTYRYKPYGSLLAKTGTGPDPAFGWVGTQGYRPTQQKFSDFYVRARHYSDELGRWTSKDPLRYRGGNVNLYRYVMDMPIALVDPSGKNTTGHEDDDQFTITTHIFFTCKGATPDVIDKVIQRILKAWNNQGEYFACHGKRVVFQIIVDKTQQKNSDVACLMPGYGRGYVSCQNYIKDPITRDKKIMPPIYIGYPNCFHYCKWYPAGEAEYEPYVVEHEYGHMLGFGDQYWEVDFNPVVPDHEHDIMAGRPDPLTGLAPPPTNTQVCNWLDRFIIPNPVGV